MVTNACLSRVSSLHNDIGVRLARLFTSTYTFGIFRPWARKEEIVVWFLHL